VSIFDKLGERVGDFIGEVLLPEDVRQAHERARRAMERGEYKIALIALQDAERQRPNLERTRYMMGLCYFYEGDYERAIGLLTEAIGLRDDPSSHLFCGLALEKLGRLAEAQAHFHRALAMGEKLPFASDLHHGLGRIYLAQRRADKAIRELRKVLRLVPEEPEAAVNLAEALLERDQLEEARSLLGRLDESALRTTRARLLVARVEESVGEYRAARAAFEAVVEAEPENREALMWAARNALETSDHARANEYLLRALEGSEGEARSRVFILLGRLNEAVGNEERAMQSYRSAIELDPRALEAWLGYGRLAIHRKSFAEAADAFRPVVAAGRSAFSREALIGLAHCRLHSGDTAGARHLLEEADQLVDGPDSEVLHGLGLVALQARDLPEAVVALQEARQAATSDRLREVIEADLHMALEALRPQWRIPERFDNPTELIQTLEAIRGWMQPDPRLARFTEILTDLIVRMDAPVSIAVVGEFNAGKSTLVNAILGEEVVPMGVLPTTAHPCIMQYGPRKAARIVYDDGRVVEVTFEDARRRMKDEADLIARLDYLYPHPELRSVNFWDTPGFNALDPRHEEHATWALEHGEAILWILDAGQVLSQTEFERIESLPDGQERLVVVINKVDRLGSGSKRAAEIEHLIEYVEDNAGELIAGCFPISALETLEVRTGKADHDPAQTGFDAMWAFLDAHIIQRSGRIKILEVSRQLDMVLEDVRGFTAELVEKYRGLGAAADELSRWIDATASDLSERRPRRETEELADQIDFVITGVEREVHEALRPRGTFITRHVLDDEDRAFVLDLLRERFDSVLERARQGVLAEIVTIENELARRMSTILNELSVTNARAMNRRLEGFFDETRVLKMVLVERVYGRLEARALGQIEAAGPAILEEVEAMSDGDRRRRKDRLAELLPRVDGAFEEALAGWYGEYFLAARRFCDRLTRDLSLLELEAQYRYDL
jgi:tetratricopeptide (TPR) repeat protein/GTPase Era involved in 16S rRNA processing